MVDGVAGGVPAGAGAALPPYAEGTLMRHDSPAKAGAETSEMGICDEERLRQSAARLDYVRQMLIELRRLSAGLEQPMLSYLIEMAAQEAGDSINATGGHS